MKKGFFLIILFAFILSLSMGCQSSETKTNQEVTPELNTNEIVDNQAIDYEQLGKLAIQKVNELKIVDPEERKWVIRAVAGAESFDKTLTNAEILEKATEMMNEDKKWFGLAKQYGVDVPDSEVTQYIDQMYSNIETNKQLQDFAKGLGFELKDYVYTLDFDRFKKDITWQKLSPILQEKYQTNNNNEVIKKYNEELAR